MEIHKSHAEEICTLFLKEKFTFFDQVIFSDILEEIRRDSVQQVIFDMSALTFIDSAGLGQLLLAHDEAAKCNKKLIIKGAAGQVKKMFAVARFETMFTLQE